MPSLKTQPTASRKAILRLSEREIVQATSDQLVRVAARVIGDMAEAEDVVQESYISAYQALTQGQFDRRSHLSAWLRRIVINRAIDALRSRRRRPRLDDSIEAGWDGAASIDSRVALVELGDWMDELVPEQRVTLVLSVFEGMSNLEIAQAMGCSEGAVEQRLVRARVVLRQRSQKMDNESRLIEERLERLKLATEGILLALGSSSA